MTYESTREPTNDLWEALSTQRAIRWFRPDPVPEELIWRVVEAATRAPSGSNLQPWGFVVIQDAALRAKIGAALRERFLERMGGFLESGINSGDRSTRLMYSGVQNIVEHFDAAPVFIVPCLVGVTSPAPEGLLAGSSIYQAAQNLLLAARGVGLGTVFTTFQQGIPELRDWLRLPDNAVPVALIPLGWPDRNFGPVKRKPVEEVTHWDAWGASRARQTAEGGA